MIPQSYYDYATRRESGGNVFAKNPRSSALGPHQFLDSTWQGLMRTRPDLGLTADGRTDPAQSARAMRAFTEENAGVLSRSGFDTNTTNLYLAHRFGPQGALQLLASDPSAPVSSVVTPAVMRANPDLNNKTVGDLTAQASTGPSKMPMEVVPALRRAPGGANYTPEGGALSAGSMMGPGALSDSGSLADGLQGAGAWLMSISDPRALSALSTLGPKAGRFQTQYDPKTGRILTIDTQTGRAVASQDPQFDPNREANQAYDKTQAEANAKLNDTIYTDAQNAQSQLASVQRAKDLVANPNIPQGALGEQRQALRNLGASMGFKMEGVPEGQELQQIASQLTLQARSLNGGMPGSLSDNDLKFLKSMTVSLGNQPEANAAILDKLGAVYQRIVDVNSMREAYVQKHGRLDEGFKREVAEFGRKNEIFKDVAAPSASPAPTGGATGGYKVLKVH